MILPQSLHLAWRNLFRNTRRTAASLVTVAFGAAGLLIYQGFNEGITNQYRENTIRVRYGNGQVFPKGYHDKVLEKPWQAWVENPEDIEKKISEVPNVLGVYPRLGFYCFLTRGGTTLAARGEGTRPEKESKFFNRMNFVEGGDIQEPLQVILGKGLAHSLDAKIGDRVTLLAQTVEGQLNGVDVTVSGIFHTGSKDFDDAIFRMDLKTAQQLLDTKRVEHFALQTAGVQVWDQVAKDIAQKLPQLEAISFDDLDAVYYKNSVAFLQAQFNFIRSIILFIVALGIFNTIAVGLLERGPEVGALRANGEKRSRLFKILFAENMLLGVLGGILGVVVAKVVEATLLSKGIPMPPGPGITRQFFTFLEIQPNHYAQAIILPAVTAVVASLWPISQLLRKPITELLRSN